MAQHISPYHAPDFFADALARGRHRDIVGGRWEETGNFQMELLIEAGLMPQHHLLDIGAGSLRLGCLAAPYLQLGHYWATDLSGALMRRGYEAEIKDKSWLDPKNLIEDGNFAFPGVPDTITHAICFAVFTHLPANHLRRALIQTRARFPALQKLLFTAFLAPDARASLAPFRQVDGVVTHDTRAPYHMLAEDVLHLARSSGFVVAQRQMWLPRGQVLFEAAPI